MMRAVRPYLDRKTSIELYYSFCYPHLIYGIEFWGHASKGDLNKVLVIQKALVRVIQNKKPQEHVSSSFKELKIMPVKMLFEFCVLKLFLRTFSTETIAKLKTKSHNYNTRSANLKQKRANNKRGERSLLFSGIALYNRYLLGIGGTCRLVRPVTWRLACGGWVRAGGSDCPSCSSLAGSSAGAISSSVGRSSL